MNIDFTLPKAKKICNANTNTNPFPVRNIDTDANCCDQFTGIFTGMAVEIFNQVSTRQIYCNGCYGIGSQSKARPATLNVAQSTDFVTSSQFDRKLQWCANFNLPSRSNVMVKLMTDKTDASEETKENDTQTPYELKIDPFPIEESLALFPEEAFFLHFSLKCLKILDFDQTRKLTTLELLEIYGNLNENFIQRFVAYQYYRSKNWIVKSGVKFGGDFLLYYKGPQYYHASYVVIVKDNDSRYNIMDVQSNYRVAETANKEVIMLYVTRPNGIDYSDKWHCIEKLSEFTVREIVPKRFQVNQLNNCSK